MMISEIFQIGGELSVYNKYSTILDLEKDGRGIIFFTKRRVHVIYWNLINKHPLLFDFHYTSIIRILYHPRVWKFFFPRKFNWQNSSRSI